MSNRHTLLRGASALLAGTVFGFGLAVAQMTDPLKVLGFLDVTGNWDASLLFVLGAAVVVAATGFAMVLRQPSPRFDDRFHLPTLTRIDRRLLAGAALFGIGWGITGYCPGPALASLASANAEALWFIPAMLAGIALQRWQSRT
jgi:uncharacterized membrane protein YedE/YeeE